MKELLRCIMFAVFIFFSSRLCAQSEQGWEECYDEIHSADGQDDTNRETDYDILCELASHPININTAAREDLERIPFLSSQQVESIMEYMYKYHAMQSLGELHMISNLDDIYARLLSYFLYIGTPLEKGLPHIADMLKYGKHEIVVTASIPAYERKGYKNGDYQGTDLKHWFRYTFSFGNTLKFGFTGAQDAGEPFFKGKNKLGYDYYSYYVMLRNVGKLKSLALGRYRLRFGMGLVINNDYSFGKLATLQTLGRSNNEIREHSSRSESNYMQGAAATVNLLKGLDITAFASYRDIDATPNKDSLNTIATITGNGYHRTVSEMSRKHNTSIFAGGGNIRYFSNGFHIGISAIYSSLNKELCPDTARIYKRWAASGTKFWNTGVDYGYICGKFSFNGETATGNSHAIATINSLSYKLLSNLQFMALQRFYAYRYYGMYANSFSDAGSIQDESGIYCGINWNLSRHTTVLIYTDYAYFAWPKYMQSFPETHSWDNMVQLIYNKKQFSLLARYRLRIRQRDNISKNALDNVNEHRGRLQLGYIIGNMQCRSQADIAYSHQQTGSLGYMLSQSIFYKYHWLSYAANIGYFHTADYQSRVYTYERGIMYNFSFPTFYGKGIRYSINLRADINKNIMIITRVGTTDYLDRSTISSGPQQIHGSSQTDIDLQLRYKF
jgi:hypothetical protein